MGDSTYLDDHMFKTFLEQIPTLKTKKMSHSEIRLMFETLLYGAMRISEVLQLVPGDLIGGGRVKLPITKGGWQRCTCSKWQFHPTRLISVDNNCIKCHGKGKFRVIEIGWIDNDDVYNDLQILASKRKPDQRLFPITRIRAWQYADQLGARTHAFRHSFLTWLLETEKMNIRDIKQKARHKNIYTTDRYIQANVNLTQQKAKGLFERVITQSEKEQLF